MAAPRVYSGPLEERRSRAHRARRTRRWTVAAVLAGTALLVTILLAAFSSPSPSFQASLSDDAALCASGPPCLQSIALHGSLRIQLPVVQQSVTALAYHGGGELALPLQPLGQRVNEGIFARIVHRLFGGGGSGVAYHQLSGGEGPQTGALDVGAPAGTVVYAPVSGTVVGRRDFVLNGRRYGHQIAIVPSDEPSVVLLLTRLRADPALTVGSPVTAATSKVGVVLDLSKAERQALSKVTHDAGNHVTIEVHPAANALP